MHFSHLPLLIQHCYNIKSTNYLDSILNDIMGFGLNFLLYNLLRTAQLVAQILGGLSSFFIGLTQIDFLGDSSDNDLPRKIINSNKTSFMNPARESKIMVILQYFSMYEC